MAVINTNMSAMVAQNSLVRNERMMSKAMQQLSTGNRINSAADDAAGMAISSVMESQTRGLGQAIRNANDAISMVQTAEGSLSEVADMLQRMRELAVQAASGTYTPTQRGFAQTEFEALAAQIKQIDDTTQFNGANLLDGTARTFQIGNTSAGTVDFTPVALETGQSTTSNTISVTTAGGAANEVATLEVSALAAAAANGESYLTTVSINGVSVELELVSDGTNFTNLKVDGIDVGTGTATITDSDGNSIELTIDTDDVTFTFATNTDAGTLSFDNTVTVTLLGTGTGTYDTVNGLDISTQAGATGALATLQTEIEDIAEARADMGAVMNRLEYAVDNLTNEQTNISAALSRVQDADYATATTELARTQIIQQAGTAMLAQANQLPQTVLSLLQ
jgi:flagellin